FGEAGEEFDPAYHNAVMHIEDEAKGKNVISQVFQRGYKLGDRVLRYAMVQTAN
ncbi:MAG: nucleotide exchange factor GrpE, partial [Angelakisella sp.]